VSWTLLKWICSMWADVTIEIRGVEKIHSEADSQVIVSNHQSSLDVLVMANLCVRKCTVMMKASLKWIPFFNLAAFLSNTIFINRSDKDSSRRAIEQAADTMTSKQLKLWIFPEGTRNREHGMLPFKKGAFNVAVQAQVPIVPVVISDMAPFYSQQERYFHSNGLIICQVMDPVPTQGLSMKDVPALCDRVRDQMLKVYEQISEEAKQRYDQGRVTESSMSCIECRFDEDPNGNQDNRNRPPLPTWQIQIINFAANLITFLVVAFVFLFQVGASASTLASYAGLVLSLGFVIVGWLMMMLGFLTIPIGGAMFGLLGFALFSVGFLGSAIAGFALLILWFLR